jgi:hypothetical protein
VNSHLAFTVIHSTQTHITTPTNHTNTAERQNRTLSRIEITLQSARMVVPAHCHSTKEEESSETVICQKIPYFLCLECTTRMNHFTTEIVHHALTIKPFLVCRCNFPI